MNLCLQATRLDLVDPLRAPQIKALLADGALQLRLFDGQDLVEITHPDYPGARLVCCHNPALEDERACNAPSCWRPPKKNSRPSPRPTLHARPLRVSTNPAAPGMKHQLVNPNDTRSRS